MTSDSRSTEHRHRGWGRRLAAVAALGIVMAALAATVFFVVELFLRDQFAQNLYREARRRPPHPFLQVLGGYSVAVNASGFRGDPISEEKPAGTFRIITLGGSTTLGVANLYEETYPFYLQQMLRERYPGVTIEVQNAGAAWYSTAHLLVNYELRVRRFEPDLIVVFEAINDLYRSFSPPWWASGPFRPDYAHFLGPYARLLGPDVDAISAAPRPQGDQWLLWRNLKRRFGNDPTPFDHHAANVARVTARLQARPVQTFRALPVFRRNYERLVRNMLADGHAVVVGSQPFLFAPDLSAADKALIYYPQIFCAEDGYYPTLDSMTAGMRQFNAEARGVAEAAHVEFVDFESAVPKTGEYFSDDVHLRAPANRILARIVFDWIVAERLIKPTPPGGRAPVPR
jgi:lysophospholipase L1-like esterase